MPEEKMTVIIDGYTVEYTIVDDMPDFGNDPFFKKKLEDVKAFLRKHPHPSMMNGADDIFDDDENP